MGKRRIVGNLANLIGNRLHHFLAAVADVHAPQAADSIDELVAMRIGNMDAGGLSHDVRAVFVPAGEVRERMDDVIMIHLPQFFCRVLAVPKHGGALSSNSVVAVSLSGAAPKGHPFFA